MHHLFRIPNLPLWWWLRRRGTRGITKVGHVDQIHLPQKVCLRRRHWSWLEGSLMRLKTGALRALPAGQEWGSGASGSLLRRVTHQGLINALIHWPQQLPRQITITVLNWLLCWRSYQVFVKASLFFSVSSQILHKKRSLKWTKLTSKLKWHHWGRVRTWSEEALRTRTDPGVECESLGFCCSWM